MKMLALKTCLACTALLFSSVLSFAGPGITQQTGPDITQPTIQSPPSLDQVQQRQQPSVELQKPANVMKPRLELKPPQVVQTGAKLTPSPSSGNLQNYYKGQFCAQITPKPNFSCINPSDKLYWGTAVFEITQSDYLKATVQLLGSAKGRAEIDMRTKPNGTKVTHRFSHVQYVDSSQAGQFCQQIQSTTGAAGNVKGDMELTAYMQINLIGRNDGQPYVEEKIIPYYIKLVCYHD